MYFAKTEGQAGRETRETGRQIKLPSLEKGPIK